MIFPSLPTGMESAVQLVDETIRLSRSQVRVNSKSISSVTTLRQRLDCYCDKLKASDYERACPHNTTRFTILIESEGVLAPYLLPMYSPSPNTP